MKNEINVALSGWRKEVIELTLLDTLWVTTQKRMYREEHESLLRYLAEKIANELDLIDEIDAVEYILGDIIEEKTNNINFEYLDIKF